MRNLLVTFSGGRSSAFMAKFCKEYYREQNLLFVFANTGKEKEETLQFVEKCDKEFGLNLVWVEAVVHPKKMVGTTYKVVNYENAARKGEPFEAVISKYGLPSKLYRHCTRELKEVPIHKYAKDYFQDSYESFYGIRADERHRIKKDKLYPLAQTLNATERFIRNWWSKNSFDLALKDYQGNCDLCFLKSKRKRLTIASEDEKLAKWWDAMEQKFATEKQPIFDVRNNLSVQEIIELSQQKFTKAQDKYETIYKHEVPFDIEMDTEFDCYCSNI